MIKTTYTGPCDFCRDEQTWTEESGIPTDGNGDIVCNQCYNDDTGYGVELVSVAELANEVEVATSDIETLVAMVYKTAGRDDAYAEVDGIRYADAEQLRSSLVIVRAAGIE